MGGRYEHATPGGKEGRAARRDAAHLFVVERVLQCNTERMEVIVVDRLGPRLAQERDEIKERAAIVLPRHAVEVRNVEADDAQQVLRLDIRPPKVREADDTLVLVHGEAAEARLGVIDDTHVAFDGHVRGKRVRLRHRGADEAVQVYEAARKYRAQHARVREVVVRVCVVLSSRATAHHIAVRAEEVVGVVGVIQLVSGLRINDSKNRRSELRCDFDCRVPREGRGAPHRARRLRDRARGVNHRIRRLVLIVNHQVTVEGKRCVCVCVRVVVSARRGGGVEVSERARSGKRGA